MSKMRLIKDNIHSHIILSEFEYDVITKTYINRLNYISQMGQIRFVYPAATHTRYIHSLGVAHLSGEYFRNAVINADSDTVNEYLLSKRKILDNIINESINDINDKLKSQEKEIYEVPNNERQSRIAQIDIDMFYNNIQCILGDKFLLYYSITLNHELASTYFLMLQVARLAGLYHDIGHIAMSHLLEQVYIEEIRRNHNFKFKNALHEQLMFLLVEEIKKNMSIVYNINNDLNNQCNIYKHIFANASIPIIKNIFSKNSKFKEIYNILSNDIDVDKIDYVLRDGLATGVLNLESDADRIILTPILISKKKISRKRDMNSSVSSHDKNKQYLILPTTRSLKNISNIFRGRSMIYNTVVGHHKSKKYELYYKILISNIISYVKEQLDNNNIIQIITKNHAVYKTLEYIENYYIDKNKKISNNLISSIYELTDHTLDIWLREIYDSILDFKTSNNSELHPKLEITYNILREIYYGETAYVPLWKDYAGMLSIVKSISSRTKNKQLDLTKLYGYKKIFGHKKSKYIRDQYDSLLGVIRLFIFYDENECWSKIQKINSFSNANSRIKQITIYSQFRNQLKELCKRKSECDSIVKMINNKVFPVILATNPAKKLGKRQKIYDASMGILPLSKLCSYYETSEIEFNKTPPLYAYVHSSITDTNVISNLKREIIQSIINTTTLISDSISSNTTIQNEC